MLFLSTLSLRRATLSRDEDGAYLVISIHALLAESDLPINVMTVSAVQISIHALLAESDLFCAMQIVVVVVFLSTLSLRRATFIEFRELLHPSYFYPRSPCGERPSKSRQTLCCIPISIHALLAESDPMQSIHHKTDQ